jgi:hypothetical protein
MKWHKLNAKGAVVATIDAPDKRTASDHLGGGTIVSALSYDATPTTQNLTGIAPRKPNYPPLSDGCLWSRDAAAKVGLSTQRFLEITRALNLTPGRATRINGSRQMFYWTPEDIALVTQYHASRYSPARLAAAQAKRRASLLTYYARKWGWLDPQPTTTESV